MFVSWENVCVLGDKDNVYKFNGKTFAPILKLSIFAKKINEKYC